MLTGNADLDVAIDAINKGYIFKFLTKPCLKQELLNTINQALLNYTNAVKQQTDSLTDSLTELWNRRYTDRELLRIFKSAERYKYKFTIIFIDMNYLKEINDQYGHEQGDLALILLAKILKKTCRNTDIIARYGGDEFLIITEHNGKDKIFTLVNRIKKNLSKKHIDENNKITLSIAAGIASYPDDAKEIISLIKIADTEMYLDKKNQKDSIND